MTIMPAISTKSDITQEHEVFTYLNNNNNNNNNNNISDYYTLQNQVKLDDVPTLNANLSRYCTLLRYSIEKVFGTLSKRYKVCLSKLIICLSKFRYV